MLSSEGVLRPVAFAGRCLRTHEKNLGITHRELLSTVYGVQHFRHYLDGRHFQLYTEHSALIQLLTNPNNTHKLACWALDIQQFSFTIHHVKGTKNVAPDFFSRTDHYPLEAPMVEPPPPPKTLKVAHRVMFSHNLDVHVFNREENPRVTPPRFKRSNSILKKTTHYHYCPCEREFKETYTDHDYQPIFESIRAGFKKKASKPIRADVHTNTCRVPLYNVNALTLNTTTVKPSKLKKKKVSPTTTAKAKVNEQITNIIEFVKLLPNNLQSITSLKKCQQSTPYITAMIDYIKNDEIPSEKKLARFVETQNSNFMIVEGLLFHTSTRLWEKYNEFTMQIVVPCQWLQNVMELFHDNPVGGHHGITTMISKMKHKVWWRNMPRDVQKYCDTCPTCLKARKIPRNQKSPMTIRDPALSPFQHVCIDALGPLPPSGEQKFKFIHLIVDFYSKYVIAFPTKSTDAEAAINGLNGNLVDIHGPPQTIQSDNGSCYKSFNWKENCAKHNIKPVYSSPYRPKSNGQAERLVKSISAALKSYAMDDPDAWSLFLPKIVMAINSSENSTTGFSPYFMVHGRHPRAIIDNLIDFSSVQKSTIQQITDMIKAQDQAHFKMNANYKVAKQKLKALHDRDARPSKIKIHDLVYIKIPGLKIGECKKTTPECMGPYIVCIFKSQTSVILRDLVTEKMVKGQYM